MTNKKNEYIKLKKQEIDQTETFKTCSSCGADSVFTHEAVINKGENITEVWSVDTCGQCDESDLELLKVLEGGRGHAKSVYELRD